MRHVRVRRLSTHTPGLHPESTVSEGFISVLSHLVDSLEIFVRISQVIHKASRSKEVCQARFDMVDEVSELDDGGLGEGTDCPHPEDEGADHHLEDLRAQVHVLAHEDTLEMPLRPIEVYTCVEHFEISCNSHLPDGETQQHCDEV